MKPITDKKYPITCNYACHKSNGSKHPGLDIGMPIGTPLKAAISGVVQAIGYDYAGGGWFLRYGGDVEQFEYAHLSKFKVGLGDKVKAGETIALSGNSGNSSGPHLHGANIVNGIYVNWESEYNNSYKNSMKLDNTTKWRLYQQLYLDRPKVIEEYGSNVDQWWADWGDSEAKKAIKKYKGDKTAKALNTAKKRISWYINDAPKEFTNFWWGHKK